MTATIGTTERVDDAPRTGRAWQVAAVVATLVATAAHAFVARSAYVKGVPTFSYDEIATLMAGRAALGLPTPEVTGAGYYPGSAILVSPLWWFTSDPVTFYRAVTVVGVLIGAVTIWPLARVATRLGLTTAQAVTVAGIVMTLPSRTIQADYALAEKVLFLCLALVVLAAIRFAERSTYLRSLTFAVAVALCYFTHARMLVLVAVAAVWLVLVGLFPLRRWRVALAGLVALGVLCWATGRLAHYVNGLVNPHGFNQGGNLLGNLLDATPGVLFRALLGQSWDQLVSSFGLAAVGLVVVVVLAWGEVRRREIGLMSFVFGAAAAIFAGSVIAWASPDQLYATSWRRLDAWLYGRYVDPVFAFLTLIALAAIVTGLQRRVLPIAWAIALLIAVPTVFWVARDAPTWGFVTPAHIPGPMAWSWALPEHRFPPGLTPSFTNGNRFWVWATLTALVPLAALLVVRRRPLAVGGLVLALAAGGTFFADRASDRYVADHGPKLGLGETLHDVVVDHPGTTVSIVEQCPARLSNRPGGRRNRFGWMLLPTVLSRSTDTDIVIACRASRQAHIPGAVTLDQPAFGVLYAWVRPGPLQDELRAEGLLPPPTS